jgi:hypothetical protein
MGERLLYVPDIIIDRVASLLRAGYRGLRAGPDRH